MNFTLRPWRLDDAEGFSRHANNPKIIANLTNSFPNPFTAEAARAFISSCLKAGEERQCCRAIVVDGNAVGSIALFLRDDVYCKSATIGYLLGEEFWNQGIVSQAIRQLCEECFSRYDLVRISAEPYATNLGSRRALEKAGFELEGILKKSVFKNGVILDSCLYALTR